MFDYYIISIIVILVSLSLIAYKYYGGTTNTIYIKVYILGAIGWLTALLLRLIPLQLTQIYFLSKLGANILDPNSILQYQNNLIVLIWGPFYAGIFEEITRYVFYTTNKSCRIDRKISPYIFGIGWGIGEAVFLYLTAFIKNLTVTANISFSDYLAGLIERLSAITIHISLSVIVFYAIYERKPKPSLILAIIIHFIFDFFIVIWILIFGNLEKNIWIWSLETAIFLTAILVYLFSNLYWKPMKEVKLSNEIDEFEQRDKIKYIYASNQNEI